VPKRRSKKRAPRCPGPSGCLALLAVDGTLKNSPPAAVQTVPASYPSTAAMLSWDRMGPQRQNEYWFLKAISRSRAAPLKTGYKLRKERNSGSAEHEMRLSETPSLYEQHREAEGQVNGCTFFGSFLSASKEMNI